MKSISGKNWEELKSTQRLVERVRIDNNFNIIQSKLVVSRNFSDEEIFSIKNNIDIENPFLKKRFFSRV